ncbi:MAG: hypothetical protein IKD88_04250 [Lachnospiraceae bacterium]|nr:hypothetical protein [Lachnospiraceae bacterium]
MAEADETAPVIWPLPSAQTGRPEENTDRLLPNYTYELAEVSEVDGRQGIAWADGKYYVSGSTTLSRYDADWIPEAFTDEPFTEFGAEVNHIGDIDVYEGEIYAGVEWFMDGAASNIQIAVYDAETLEMTRTWPFEPESGQTEVSGIAVDPDSGSVWMCSWADGESGRYLYRYDLATGAYLGKLHLQAPPQWIQGIVYHDGWIYMTADDGTADLGEPDHVYRCDVSAFAGAENAGAEPTAAPVFLERTLDDVTLQGEIEGISFDTDAGRLLVSYNRGARIVLGMPSGFYEGYAEEIHEVFAYEMTVN